MNWQATALTASDNVAVAMAPLVAGQRIVVRSPAGLQEIVALEAIPLCHKIALAALAKGDPVLRYGQCIGVASADIRCGALVHVHNLVSRRARTADMKEAI